jgi:hypothetical protein
LPFEGANSGIFDAVMVLRSASRPGEVTCNPSRYF